MSIDILLFRWDYRDIIPLVLAYLKYWELYALMRINKKILNRLQPILRQVYVRTIQRYVVEKSAIVECTSLSSLIYIAETSWKKYPDLDLYDSLAGSGRSNFIDRKVASTLGWDMGYMVDFSQGITGASCSLVDCYDPDLDKYRAYFSCNKPHRAIELQISNLDELIDLLIEKLFQAHEFLIALLDDADKLVVYKYKVRYNPYILRIIKPMRIYYISIYGCAYSGSHNFSHRQDKLGRLRFLLKKYREIVRDVMDNTQDSSLTQTTLSIIINDPLLINRSCIVRHVDDIICSKSTVSL